MKIKHGRPIFAIVPKMRNNLPTVLKSSALATLEGHAKELVLREMRTLEMKRGAAVFHAGDSASNYVMVKSGVVRVSVTTEQGREIVLYRVEPGETCVLTTSSLLSGAEYDAEAIAEDDTEAVILPKPAFDELMATSARFRQFVFSSFGERLHTLIGLVQEVTLKHVDRRLARYLVLHQKDGVVTSTHQHMAQDLNTAREVVTRLLSDFAERGWVEVARGRVIIRNQAALEDLASPM
jgi:CRP/FNR family transcriptional regulator, anaerobic regulatory protein